MFHQICALLGGRVAEEMFFDSVTSGAYDDLAKVTEMAYNQVLISVYTYIDLHTQLVNNNNRENFLNFQITRLGFSERIGELSFTQENTWQKPYSEKTAQLIDEEVRKLVAEAKEKTKELLLEHKEDVEKVRVYSWKITLFISLECPTCSSNAKIYICICILCVQLYMYFLVNYK